MIFLESRQYVESLLEIFEVGGRMCSKCFRIRSG